MKTLLEQIQTELKKIFDNYDNSQHVPSVYNARYIARIKSIIENSNSAFIIIKTLPSELDRLDTKFWSILKLVKDPIRDLKENIRNILLQPKYLYINVLIMESVELRSQNAVLNKRLLTLEKTLEPDKKSDLLLVASNQTASTNDEKMRAEIETEVQQEIATLRRQLADSQQKSQRLEDDKKRLEYKCKAYQDMTVKAVSAKEDYEQQLIKTKDALHDAQAEIMRLVDENRQLRQQLNMPSGKNSAANDSIKLVRMDR